MAEATELLHRVLKLIERDVEAIDRLGKHGDKLDHLVSQDLVRYSGALLDLSQNLEKEEGKRKSRLANMSTEELMELAKDIVK